MLETQGPPLMPHAVPFDRPVDVFTPQTYQRITNPQLQSGLFSRALPTSTSTRPNLPTFTRQLTPPSDMNVGINHGRMTAQHSGPHLSKDASGYGQQYGQPPQPHHYSNSSFPKQTPSYLNGAAKSFPSPKSHRSATTQESKEASRAAENNVAPSLRVPDTVRTPQSGIAQLAAEVGEPHGESSSHRN